MSGNLKLESSYQNPGSLRNLLHISPILNGAHLHVLSQVPVPAIGEMSLRRGLQVR